MPIESNEPPGPLFDELCSLTKMTSANEIRDASLNVTKVKVMKRMHRGRADHAPIDNAINKVLFDLESGSLNFHLKFSVGSSVESQDGCPLSKSVNSNDFVNGNDGSFINSP
nr:hypothetical protein [Tanacetum cinerariifolium]